MDSQEEEKIPEEAGEFAFETDHLALRGNTDYNKLLKYLVKLEAQKVQALKDIELLNETKSKALETPLIFLEDLKSGAVNFPPRQSIANVPHIEWEKYGIDVSLESESNKKMKQEIETAMKVRGRTFTDNKPETFNQLWSFEEQKRLEELLDIYPEEPIEARRYRKIAKALGTRTTTQVMSRVQKYFSKLAKAGLPIPGRIPKQQKSGKDKHKNMFYKKSTFFPKLHVPVKMEDPNEDIEDQESLNAEERYGNKSILDLLRAAKAQRLLDETSPVFQTKTMCVGCQKTNFLGARWTDNAGTDYCTDCIVKLLPTEKLTPVRQPI